jgi:hypothetical protein
MALLSNSFRLMTISKCSPTTPQRHAATVWALPFSLATTQGIIIIFFSSRYLDVSVLGVGSLLLEYYTFSIVGCPIRRSRDIMLVCNSPWLIAAYHVLLRLSDPRHPPCALIRFKKIQMSLLARLRFLFTNSNVLLLLLQLLFPNMSKNLPDNNLTAIAHFADV